MNVLGVIDLCKTKFGLDSRKTESIKRYGQAQNQIAHFLQVSNYGINCNALCLVDPAFINDFCRHLFAEGKYASNSTVYGWIDAVRRIAREAMKCGLIPKADFFTDVVCALEKEYPNDKRGLRSRASNSFDCDNAAVEFEKLLRFLSAKDDKLTESEKLAFLYLFGVFCFGLEISEIATLKLDDERNNVQLPQLGVSLPFSGTLKSIADKFNGKKYAGQSLFKIFEGADEDNARLLAAEVSNKIAKLFNRLNLRLFASKSIQTDWLRIAADNGANLQHVARVAHAVVSNSRQSLTRSDFERISMNISDRPGYISNYWRVLCSYSAALASDKLSQKIRDIDNILPTDVKVGRIQIYNPQEVQTKRVKGKLVNKARPVMGRYLFVQCSLPDCEIIERTIPNASFLRQTDNHTVRATISDDEIRKLMYFFRDYGAGMSLVDISEWAKNQEINLEEGQKVKVKGGLYAGYEGVIINKKNGADASGSTKIFIVKIVGLPNLAIAGNVTASLRGLELEAV